MPKKARAQGLKPDTVLKNYWSNNEQFADLFNAVLFDGEQVIKPEELEDVDAEESTVLEHRKYAESIQISRDVIKVQKRSLEQGVEFVMLGMESQTTIHYAMPLRVMGYDYASYKKQYDSNAKSYKLREGMSEDEFLSRMKKEDRFIPVITVVVYYGDESWNGATSLHGILNIPKRLERFVNDYKLLLVEARRNGLVLHNMNNRDLFNLLEIILDKTTPTHETRRKAIEYTQEHRVDRDVIVTVAGATNCKIDFDSIGKEGEIDMCTVFEETWAEGKAEGKAEGIIKLGYDVNLSEEDILARLQDLLDVSLQKAQEYLHMFGKETV